MAHGKNTITVPGELRAVDTEGVVVAAEGVKDYIKGKTQEQINADIYTEITNIKGGSTDSIASLKQDINQEISARSEAVTNEAASRNQAIASEAAARQQADQDTLNTVNTAISQQNQTISTAIRQQNDTISGRFNTQDEKMDNMQATINEKQLEIGAVQTDDEPTPNSGNHLTSGTIAAYYGSYTKNPEYVYCVLDAVGHILLGIKTDGKLYADIDSLDGTYQTLISQVQQMIDEENQTIDEKIAIINSIFSLQNNPEWIQVTTDAEGKILEGITTKGEKYIARLIGLDSKIVTELGKYNPIVPEFYQEHIQEKVKQITEKMCSCGLDGDSFIFITDTHWESNWKYSPSLVKYILDNTEITKVFHGGDLIHGTVSDNTEYAKDILKRFKFTTLYPSFGNHDQYIKISSEQGGTIYTSNDEIYTTFFKHLEDKVNTNCKFYYYIDNPSQKIRYFILDAHWTRETDNRNNHLNYIEQLDWLEQKAAELGLDWNIVVIQHIVFSAQEMDGQSPVAGTVQKSELAQQLVARLDNMCDDTNMPTVIALIAGHTHYDYYEYSEKGYPIIATNCDGSWGWALENGVWVDNDKNINRPKDSTDAQSFDVFTIDKQNRKIYAVRVGYGENREFTY